MRTYIVSILLFVFALSLLKKPNNLEKWRFLVIVSVFYVIAYDIFDLYISINSLTLQFLWFVAIIITIIGISYSLYLEFRK